MTINETDSSETELSTLEEIVRVSTNGEVIRAKLGRYSLRMTFINRDTETNTTFGSFDENRQVLNFFANVTFLPRISPIDLSMSRQTLEFELTGEGLTGGGTETTTTSYNLSWLLPRIWKLPQLSLTLFYSVVETSGQKKSSIFGGSVSASDRYPYRYVIKNTELNWNISFSSNRPVGGGRTRLNVGALLTADSQWTPALKSNVRVSVASGASFLTPSVPGNVPIATDAGVTFFYRPSLRFNSSGRYGYSRDVFDRHNASFQALYRPTPKFDIRGSARMFFLSLDKSDLFSVSGSGQVAYRPMLNLSTSLTVSVGLNQTFGTVPSQSIFHNYGISANYFKVLELVRFNTSGSINYGGNMSDVAGNGSSVNGNVSLQATNTKTRYVTTSGSYSSYYSRSSEGGQEQWTNSIRLDASSSYFSELLLRGDRLSLHLGVADTFTNNRADNSQNFNVTMNARYSWRSVAIGTGYAIRLSTAGAHDSDTYFGDIRWTPRPWYRISSNFHAKYTKRMFEKGIDRSTWEADTNFSYQIGRVRLGVQYRFLYRSELSTTMTHNLFVRMSRSFSL